MNEQTQDCRWLPLPFQINALSVRFLIVMLGVGFLASSAPAQAGVWRIQGIAGRCLDVGGYASGTVPPWSSVIATAQPHSRLPQSRMAPGEMATGIWSCVRMADALLSDNSKGKGSRRQLRSPTHTGPTELTACSDVTSQRFAYHSFDRQYIYSAGSPELANDARGLSTAIRTDLEL